VVGDDPEFLLCCENTSGQLFAVAKSDSPQFAPLTGEHSVP
jgi:hypothetical protein